jgi:uncharacterized protein
MNSIRDAGLLKYITLSDFKLKDLHCSATMKRWLARALLSASLRTTQPPLLVAEPQRISTVVDHRMLFESTNRWGKKATTASAIQHRCLSMRGGGDGKEPEDAKPPPQYVVLSEPAPGSPFHYAFPVHNLQVAKEFYGTVLGCLEGRSSEKWQDYSLYGHQIVAHWVGDDYQCRDYYNPVDGDEVPVPHAGIALTVDQFHELADRLRNHGIQFIIEPHLRFQGMPGEQYTMFFKDPSGTCLCLRNAYLSKTLSHSAWPIASTIQETTWNSKP